MSAIGPGDYVEALRDIGNPARVFAGRVYVVETIETRSDDRVCRHCRENGMSGSRVAVFLVQPRGTIGLCPCAFRPVYRPKGTFEQLLKQPEPA